MDLQSKAFPSLFRIHPSTTYQAQPTLDFQLFNPFAVCMYMLFALIVSYSSSTLTLISYPLSSHASSSRSKERTCQKCHSLTVKQRKISDLEKKVTVVVCDECSGISLSDFCLIFSLSKGATRVSQGTTHTVCTFLFYDASMTHLD